jgi:hypothetical protein
MTPTEQQHTEALVESVFLRAGLSEEHARLRAQRYIADVIEFGRELTEKATPMLKAVRWPKLKGDKQAALDAAATVLIKQIVEASIQAYQSSKMREALAQIAAAIGPPPPGSRGRQLFPACDAPALPHAPL